jgi:hypothetical protein
MRMREARKRSGVCRAYRARGQWHTSQDLPDQTSPSDQRRAKETMCLPESKSRERSSFQRMILDWLTLSSHDFFLLYRPISFSPAVDNRPFTQGTRHDGIASEGMFRPISSTGRFDAPELARNVATRRGCTQLQLQIRGLDAFFYSLLAFFSILVNLRGCCPPSFVVLVPNQPLNVLSQSYSLAT